MKFPIFSELISTSRYLVAFVSLVVTALYLLSLSERVRAFIYKQSYTKKEKAGLILFFGVLGILASEFGLKFFGIIFNFRDCIAIFAGILGGPVVGIGAGLISGLYRMTGVIWTGFTGTIGFWSAIGCGVATVGAGFVGAWLSKYRKINIKTITNKEVLLVVLITAFWEVIHLEVIVPLISPLYTTKTISEIAILFAQQLLIPMVIANALGILLFLLIAKDIALKREAELALKELRKAEEEIKEIEEKK